MLASAREMYREHPETEGASENAIIERIAGKICERKDQLLADAKRELAQSLEDEGGAILCGMSGADRDRLARHVRALPPKKRSPLVIKAFRVLSELERMRQDLRRSQRREPWSSTYEVDFLLEFFFVVFKHVALGDEFYETVMVG